MKIQKILETSILALLVLTVYLFTVNPLTKEYSFYALFLCLFFSVSIYFYSFRKNRINHQHKKMLKILIFTFITAILLWVGTTGWYLSPFFYMLYIVGISLGFLFSRSAAFSFVLVLIAILLPSFGEITGNFDIVTVFSLFLIIPLSYFLSNIYLKMKEKEKKILVLQNENRSYKSKVDELLSNKITKVSAQLREPLNDIQQLSYYYPKRKTLEAKEEYIRRIIVSSKKALKLIDSFEEDTTGRKITKV